MCVIHGCVHHILYYSSAALQKHTPVAHPDHACLNNAVEKMKETLMSVNLYVRLTYIQGYFACAYCLLYMSKQVLYFLRNTNEDKKRVQTKYRIIIICL